MNKFWIPVILLLAAINVALFWPGSLYFLNDDFIHIPLTDQGAFFQTNSVRPLHELLVKLDLWLWGKNAYGYHITALVMHFIVCFQLYHLTVLISRNWLNVEVQHSRKVAFLTVILFLIYSQNSESIAWILGRTPVLSAIFFLVSMQVFFNAQHKSKHLFIGWFFFAAALFTYEQSVLVPVVLLWIAYREKDKPAKRWQLIYSSGLIGVCGIYIFVRKLITSEVVGNYEGQNFVGFQLKNLLANAFRFFSRLFLNPGGATYYMIGCIVLITGLGAIVYLNRKQLSLYNKSFVFFTGIIAVMILPVLSLGISTHSFESGRYLYLPSLFLMMATSWFVFSSPGKHKFSYVILSVVILYWIGGKYQASVHYKDASAYAKNTEAKVQDHFAHSAESLVIDTLKLTVHRLPVYRLGFKEGIKWLNNKIDTNRITIRNYTEN